jgi:ferritin-like metal-binding protein YciE
LGGRRKRNSENGGANDKFLHGSLQSVALRTITVRACSSTPAARCRRELRFYNYSPRSEQLMFWSVLQEQFKPEDVMAKEKELKDLFLDTLKDIYFAEKKILSALPKMAKAAQSPKLKAAFEKHEAETDAQVERLEQVFASIDEAPKGKTCDAIVGIIEEGKEIMDEYKGMPALDAGLLASAQAVEHYEISRYGTLRTWANQLGYEDAVKLIEATLAEEKKTDSALSQLAETEVNQHAETAQAA